MALQRLIGSLALFAALTVCGVAVGSVTAPALPRAFRSSSEGISVRYPSDWVIAAIPTGFVTNPALCFDVAPARGAGVDLKVVEYLPPLRPRDLGQYAPRPSDFRLAMLQRSDADWTTGRIVSFKDHGRVFYVGIVIPATSSTSMRQTIEAIIDSMKVRSAGRC